MTTATATRTLYSELSERVGKRKSRKVANNTYVEVLEDGIIGVRLHKTHVVTAYESGEFVLDTGGWLTITTRDRINRFSPVRMWSDRGVQWVSLGARESVRYFDGIRFNNDGLVLNPQPDNDLTERDAEVDKLKRKISAYAKKCAEMRPYPSKGDCWLCSNPKLGDTSHLLEHLDEGYVHGSIILNAMRERGWHDAGIRMAFEGHLPDQIRSCVRRYLNKRLIPDRATS